MVGNPSKTTSIKISEDLYKKLEKHCRARGVQVKDYLEETIIERIVREQL